MADLGVLQGLQEDGDTDELCSGQEIFADSEGLSSEIGQLICAQGEKENLESEALNKKVGIAPPEIRRSVRKKSMRPSGSRGSRKPKSPLMRMAEVPKYGLRGRDLRHSGCMGSEGSEERVNKDRKGSAGRRLASIPEVPATAEGLEEGSNGLGDISRCEELVGV